MGPSMLETLDSILHDKLKVMFDDTAKFGLPLFKTDKKIWIISIIVYGVI